MGEVMVTQDTETVIMEPVVVVNKYKLKEQLPPGYTPVYIGRPSEYGNPFLVGEKYKRGEAVKAYEAWAEKEDIDYPKLRSMLSRGLKIALVCFCHPKPCHGDVIKKRLHEKTAHV